MFADRIRNIQPSGIRRVFDLGASLPDPIDLSIGQAHFDVPDPVKEVAIDQIRRGFNKYTPTQGIPELRDAIAAFLKQRYQVELESVFVTAGASDPLLLADLALLNPGDEILLPDPYFIMYKHHASLCSATPVFYNTYPDFTVSAAAVEAKVTPKTKILLINTPQNPTGAVYTEAEIKALADVARRHDLIVISDEIYERFVYDRPHVSFAKFYPKTILVSGFSKSLAMTGWRVGYVAGPAEILEKMKTLQQFSYVCAPAPFQKACAAAINLDMTPYIDDYRRKRDMLYNGLKDRFTITRPAGTFYMFPQVPEGYTDMEFVETCIQNNVLLVPGSACSERNTHFRLSFATTDEKLKRGIDVLNRIAQMRK